MILFSEYLNEEKSDRPMGQTFKVAFPMYNGDVNGIVDRIIEYYEYFPPNGDFQAYYAAEGTLKEQGYNVCSMYQEEPIAFYRGNIIGKWFHLKTDERQQIDGVLIPDPTFRSGGVHMVYFKFPN